MSSTNQYDGPTITPTLDPVAGLLREGVLEVPPYQRSYAWTTNQVETFWFDLRAALTAGEPLYFLGTVVISNGPGERSVVIDGQQRLATTSLLLAAIRDAFALREDRIRARTVQDRYLSWASLESTEVEPRLLLNEQDRAFFNSIVGDGPAPPAPSETDPDSVQRLYSAFSQLSAYLGDDIAAAGPHWQNRLLTWVSFLDRTVRMIVVRVRDDADAFLIFETLNARGVELSAADLVKNYLFGLCRQRLDEAQESWAETTQAIEASASSTEITTFLRHWWASRNGAVREKELYRRLKLAVQSQDQALETLRGLRTAAPLYAAMLNAEDAFWMSSSDTSRESMSVLLELGLEQYRPLLLAGLEHFSPREADRLLVALASWSVRGLVSGGIGGGTTERYYAEAAVRISRGRVDSTAEVLRDLDPVLASDEDFAAQFATRRVSRTRILHYYLRAIAEGRAVPDRTEDETAVVPIFPRSDPSGAWAGYISAEVLPRTSMRIGNYFLVPRDEVRGLPREPQARIERVSSLDLITGGTARSWSAEAVAERQSYLAERALATWPRQPQ